MKILIRGAGDLATGIAARLYHSGHNILMTEREAPLTVRRTVAFSRAVYEGSAKVEDMEARLVHSLDEAYAVMGDGNIALIVDEAAEIRKEFCPDVVVDAILAKKNLGTKITDAPLVVGVGPGFYAGQDCHCVVETKRGHTLGQVIYDGAALPNTGVPGEVGGYTTERLLKASGDGENTIVQVASGRFGVHEEYLNAGAGIEIKMGQGAKPGIGGHLPGAKIVGDVSRTRMIPEGSDAISPAPHHDIYSIEDLRQLVYSLKEATEYKKPIIVKVAAVHNIAAIASGIARSGADIIAIDGFRGGTGAAPTRIRDNVGIPIELALAAVDQRLRDEGIRNHVSLVVGGSIRSASDVVKAIALGADACYIATAALLALGCHLCRTCQSGKCNWGIATQRPELVKRLNPETGSQRLVNLMTAWKHEMKELMGGMGINSIEALRGNRLMLRGIGLTEKELEILGISHAGEC